MAAPLYVATPALLAHYRISPSQIDPTADILTSQPIIPGVLLAGGPRLTTKPTYATANLPTYRSDPNTLITTHAVQALGLQVVPSGWLIQTPRALTTTQIDTARKLAAAVA